ncbi:vegetative cell wall protein gp1-like [Ischnura elegans]|uniref:vegetative cell wall protein gp1-like n=1 Tax=Ischnura elegans TaxID=197161 RepID=UPI001ED86CEB|nr:vegetative cell wall protein gp1-like [Ischnura elegans]
MPRLVAGGEYAGGDRGKGSPSPCPPSPIGWTQTLASQFAPLPLPPAVALPHPTHPLPRRIKERGQPLAAPPSPSPALRRVDCPAEEMPSPETPPPLFFHSPAAACWTPPSPAAEYLPTPQKTPRSHTPRGRAAWTASPPEIGPTHQKE